MALSDDDFDTDLAGLLSDEDDEALLNKKKLVKSVKPIANTPKIPNPVIQEASKKSVDKQTPKTQTSGVNFNDNDADDLMNNLGFDDSPKIEEFTNQTSTRRSSKSFIDDVFGKSNTKKIDLARETVKTEKPETPPESATFGSYSPSVSNVKSRTAARRSVRFQDDVTSNNENGTKAEKHISSEMSTTNTHPDSSLKSQKLDSSLSPILTIGASRRRHSKSPDWLSLGTESFLTSSEKKNQYDDNLKSKNVSPELFKNDSGITQTQLGLHKIDNPKVKDSKLLDKLLEQEPVSRSDQQKQSTHEIVNVSSKSPDHQMFSSNPASSLSSQPQKNINISQTSENVLLQPQTTFSPKISSNMPYSSASFNNNLPQNNLIPYAGMINSSIDENAIFNLQTKIKSLEMENVQHIKTIERMQEAHQLEISALDTSYKKQLQINEKMYQNQEERYKSENELLSLQLQKKTTECEQNKKQTSESYQDKLDNAHKEQLSVIEKIKEMHQKEVATIKSEHDAEILKIKELKEHEVTAALSTGNHVKSIQKIVENLESNSLELSELHSMVLNQHNSGVLSREMELKIKDKQLQELEIRLHSQQSEMESERERLQMLIIKLEKRIEEEKMRNEEERWQLRQQKSKLDVEKRALEEEKKMIEERVQRERSQLDKAKQSILDEQKILVEKLCDEHKNLSSERAIIAGKNKLLSDEEINQSFKNMKVAAEYEGAMTAVKEESIRLEMKKQDLQQESHKVFIEKQKLKQSQRSIELEKQRLHDLALEMKHRSLEIEEMCKQAVQTRKDGELALQKSLSIENTHADRLKSIQEQLSALREKERQMFEEKQKLDMERSSLRQENETRNLDVSHKDFESVLPFLKNTSNPIASPNVLHSKLYSWHTFSIKDKEFLEKENAFLDGLRSSYS